MKTKKYLLTLATLIFLIVGCTDKDHFTETETSPELKSSNPKLKIVVVSDIHYMDHSLLPENPEVNADFQSLLFSSYNKMVEMSEPIFLKTISELKHEKPDVLLVPGDLAFNGELVNHAIVQAKLQELADEGTQVLVVPGNNDINSPDALSYVGTGSSTIASISPEDFVSMYGNFVYTDALYRDANSLSYFFKIREDLWILGIDACIYYPEYDRGGEINPITMIWIQEKMAEANANNITVLAMMHHGIAEQYTNQSKVVKDDIVKDFNWVSSSLMDAGIKFIFTGHSHANDIVEVSTNGNSIFDVATGSLITPLSPYRVITIDNNFIKIGTKRITSIDAQALPQGVSFITYSDYYLAEHLNMFFNWYLVNKFGLPTEMAEASLPCLVKSIMAQFAGDENLLPNEAREIEVLSELYPYDNPVVPLIKNFWNDLLPADDKLYMKIR